MYQVFLNSFTSVVAQFTSHMLGLLLSRHHQMMMMMMILPRYNLVRIR